MVTQFSMWCCHHSDFFAYMLRCIASLIVNIPAKQIRTNVCGKYWIAKILRNLVNDTQFNRFSPSLLVITVKLLKICHHACMLVGSLNTVLILSMCVHKLFCVDIYVSLHFTQRLMVIAMTTLFPWQHNKIPRFCRLQAKYYNLQI